MNISAQDKFNRVIEQGAEASTYIKAYVDTQIELKKIEASNKASKGVSSAVSGLITTFFIVLIFFFAMLALGFYLSELFHSQVYGFLAVSGILFIIYLIFLLLKKPMVDNVAKRKINNAMFGVSKLPKNAEENLKSKSKELEGYIQQTSQELPKAMKSINAKDFVPEAIYLGSKENRNDSMGNKLLNVTLNQAFNLVKKRFFS